MTELDAKIEDVKERLRRSERNKVGLLVTGRLHDELIVEVEHLLEQRTLRRPALSERLGLSLMELTTLEEEIFRLREQQARDEARRVAALCVDESDVIESIQFQAVSVRSEKEVSQPKGATFQDSRTWFRIISMTGVKIEVNSLEGAQAVLKTVLQAHRRPDERES
jgi:hypothetical protein